MSDCTKHDSAFVYAALTIIIPKIKVYVKKVKKLIYFTDGAKQHFKNRYQIDLLRHHQQDFGLDADWHFNTIAHGRSVYDGLGAVLKTAAYKHSLKVDAKNAIVTYPKLVEWAKGNFNNVTILHFEKSYHDIISKRLAKRYSLAPAIKGISQNHSFSLDKNKNLVIKRFSTDKESVIMNY